MTALAKSGRAAPPRTQNASPLAARVPRPPRLCLQPPLGVRTAPPELDDVRQLVTDHQPPRPLGHRSEVAGEQDSPTVQRHSQGIRPFQTPVHARTDHQRDVVEPGPERLRKRARHCAACSPILMAVPPQPGQGTGYTLGSGRPRRGKKGRGGGKGTSLNSTCLTP